MKKRTKTDKNVNQKHNNPADVFDNERYMKNIQYIFDSEKRSIENFIRCIAKEKAKEKNKARKQKITKLNESQRRFCK